MSLAMSRHCSDMQQKSSRFTLTSMTCFRILSRYAGVQTNILIDPLLNLLQCSLVARDAQLHMAIFSIDNRLEEQAAAVPAFSFSNPLHLCLLFKHVLYYTSQLMPLQTYLAEHQEFYNRCSSFCQVGCVQRNHPS